MSSAAQRVDFHHQGDKSRVSARVRRMTCGGHCDDESSSFRPPTHAAAAPSERMCSDHMNCDGAHRLLPNQNPKPFRVFRVSLYLLRTRFLFIAHVGGACLFSAARVFSDNYRSRRRRLFAHHNGHGRDLCMRAVCQNIRRIQLKLKHHNALEIY